MPENEEILDNQSENNEIINNKEDNKSTENNEKTYTQKELDDLLKQKDTDYVMRENVLKAQLENTTSKVDKITDEFTKLLNEREQEKIANMDEQKRNDYLRKKAKDEKLEADRIKDEETLKKIKDADEKLADAKKLIVNSTRKDLAIELGLPRHLHKYIGGDEEETITASINQLKADYAITQEVIDNKVKEKVTEKFKTGGVEFKDGGIGEAKLNLADFTKMTTMEKANMMVNNRPLFDKYRELQRKHIGNLE